MEHYWNVKSPEIAGTVGDNGNPVRHRAELFVSTKRSASRTLGDRRRSLVSAERLSAVGLNVILTDASHRQIGCWRDFFERSRICILSRWSFRLVYAKISRRSASSPVAKCSGALGRQLHLMPSVVGAY